MTTRAKRKVESALTGRGFKRDDTHHHRFVHYNADGHATGIRTHTSHGAKPKDLGNALVKDMADQCRLSKADFLRLVDCDLTREGYERFVHRRAR